MSVVEAIDVMTERIKKGIRLFGEKELLPDQDRALRNQSRDAACQKLCNMIAAKEAVGHDTR